MFWQEHLIGKRFSEFYLDKSLDKKSRVIKNLELGEDEDVLIINYNTPYQAYADEIKKRYEQRDKTEKLPQFLIEKYPDYLKTYDLRTWGEQEGRMMQKQGEDKSCIGWDDIGQYLYEQNLSKAKDKKRIRQLSTQGISSQYKSAKDLIEGGYKKLLQYKGHTKTQSKYKGVVIKDGKAVPILKEDNEA